MSEIFNGEWWSVRLPDGWCGQPEEHGASFFRTPTLGTLQISAARKSGGQISERDLEEFASERFSAGHKLESIQHDAFSGYQCIRSEGSLSWYEWWLKYGSLMIYATYIVPTDIASATEKEQVIRILESLAPR